MGKDFPDPGMFAHMPPAPATPSTDSGSFVKVVPTVPASQSDRPQLRPVE